DRAHEVQVLRHRLLGQPHGFEGLGVIEVGADSADLGHVKVKDASPRCVDCRAAASPLRPQSPQCEYPAAHISVLLGDRTKLMPRFAYLAKECFDAPAAPVDGPLNLRG